LSQEAHEFLSQDLFQVISLLDGNTDANGVDRTFNQNLTLRIEQFVRVFVLNCYNAVRGALTFSFSFLAITTGFNNNSGLVL